MTCAVYADICLELVLITPGAILDFAKEVRLVVLGANQGTLI